MLDIILAAYFRWTKELDIAAEAQLAIPDELSVSAARFSNVVTNALDTIHVVGVLPMEQRRIGCKCIDTPRLMVGFFDPCAEEMSDGPPVPKKGTLHGSGACPITAFAKKYRHCQFRLHGQWRLKVWTLLLGTSGFC